MCPFWDALRILALSLTKSGTRAIGSSGCACESWLHSNFPIKWPMTCSLAAAGAHCFASSCDRVAIFWWPAVPAHASAPFPFCTSSVSIVDRVNFSFSFDVWVAHVTRIHLLFLQEPTKYGCCPLCQKWHPSNSTSEVTPTHHCLCSSHCGDVQWQGTLLHWNWYMYICFRVPYCVPLFVNACVSPYLRCYVCLNRNNFLE